MLKKKYRLSILAKKEKYKTIDVGPFILKISGNNQDYSRFGFSVSRAYDKRAVVRNRIKRQLRVLIEENLKNFASGKDLLFVLKKKAKDESAEKLLETFKKTLIKEKLIND